VHWKGEIQAHHDTSFHGLVGELRVVPNQDLAMDVNVVVVIFVVVLEVVVVVVLLCCYYCVVLPVVV
jgi:hypothetical protein